MMTSASTSSWSNLEFSPSLSDVVTRVCPWSSSHLRIPSSFSVVPRSSGTYSHLAIASPSWGRDTASCLTKVPIEGRYQHTSWACLPPSYKTSRTLTFSRFPVSVLMLPSRLLNCTFADRSDASGVPFGKTRWAAGADLAAAEAVKSERVAAGVLASRETERVRNTILNESGCVYRRCVLGGVAKQERQADDR